MCGIAGILHPDLAPADAAAALGRMCAALQHRGPDDAGTFQDGPATLGMRRLAIFDVANGRQPMVSPDGRYALVFNGAIYNFPALRAELGGWTFRTACDTEVLLAAYARWGDACVPRLRGMFAFAVWDTRERRLFVARDPLGIKPLYVHTAGATLAFASEVNALLASGLVPADLDPDAVADHLGWLAVPAPGTLFRGIQSLRPGESGVWQSGRWTLRTYWDFRSIPEAGPRGSSAEDFTRELRQRLEDTVAAHRVADVPVGAFLSGGLDSAAVVGLLARSTSGLRTFSIGFEEADYSEAAAAEATARHFGTRHTTRLLRGAEVVADLPRILAAMDQPTGDGINTYYASETARRGGVTVALSGLGADELFGGYPSFRDLPRWEALLPAWHLVPAQVRTPLLRSLRRRGTRGRKLADLLSQATTRNEIASLLRRVFDAPSIRGLLSADVRANLPGRDPFHPQLGRLERELAGAGCFETASGWELRTYMADVLLRDSDVMSMAHSLELRVPFVDRPLLEWLWRQPASLKSPAGRPKEALYRALADLLPPGLGERPKRGFTLPFPRWMRAELRPFLEETFQPDSAGRSGLLDPTAVTAAWRGFRDGHDDRGWSRVWSLAMLIAFTHRAWPAAPSRDTRVATLTATSGGATGDAGPTLLLAPELFAREGGVARALQSHLQALCELHGPTGEVRVAVLNDARIGPAEAARAGAADVREWRACGGRKLRFTREALGLARGCRRIICGHVGQLPVAWLASRLQPGLRYSLIAHGIEVWRSFPRWEQRALQGADQVWCVSAFTRDELLRRVPLAADRVHVLPNGLAPAFPLSPGTPLANCPPVMLAVARLSSADRYKGIDDLIRALPAVRARVPGARLRIVGRGDDLGRLQGLAAASGITEAVEFSGYLNDEALAEAFRTCRLFALPSSGEGFGLVYLEAMARGRPCLGAAAGGAPEVISPASGVLVPSHDVPRLAEACAEALVRPWDEAAILARARQFDHTSFRRRLGVLLAA